MSISNCLECSKIASFSIVFDADDKLVEEMDDDIELVGVIAVEASSGGVFTFASVIAGGFADEEGFEFVSVITDEAVDRGVKFGNVIAAGF